MSTTAMVEIIETTGRQWAISIEEEVIKVTHDGATRSTLPKVVLWRRTEPGLYSRVTSINTDEFTTAIMAHVLTLAEAHERLGVLTAG